MTRCSWFMSGVELLPAYMSRTIACFCCHRDTPTCAPAAASHAAGHHHKDKYRLKSLSRATTNDKYRHPHSSCPNHCRSLLPGLPPHSIIHLSARPPPPSGAGGREGESGKCGGRHGQEHPQVTGRGGVEGTKKGTSSCP